MSVNRILITAAVVCFAITALSAFSDSISVNEMGWLALGLTAWAASALSLRVDLTAGRRRRVLR